jgi:hypothetical protein
MELSLGPGLRIDNPQYSGRYRELVVGAKARFRLIHVPGFSTVVALGGAAHRAMLQGTLAANSRDSNVKRWNGSLDFETSVNFALSPQVYVGVSIGAAYAPAYRRYLVGGDPVFAPWPLTAHLAGYCGVELF